MKVTRTRESYGAFLYQNPNPENPKIQNPNPKNGYSVFLVKSKTGLLIQMIHNGGTFFGSYPKRDTLDTRSEEFLYYGSEKKDFVGRLYRNE